MRATRPSAYELDKPFRAERCRADAELAQSYAESGRVILAAVGKG